MVARIYNKDDWWLMIYTDTGVFDYIREIYCIIPDLFKSHTDQCMLQSGLLMRFLRFAICDLISSEHESLLVFKIVLPGRVFPTSFNRTKTMWLSEIHTEWNGQQVSPILWRAIFVYFLHYIFELPVSVAIWIVKL